MVAVVTGNGLGLGRSSVGMLGSRGQLGSAALGRANDGVTLNAANGNLVIGNRDELLVGRGPDVSINRTYNSLGQFTDDNGDNWASIGSRVVDFVGGWFAAGSYLDRLDWDGGRTRYTFDTGKGVYVSREGAGAYDSITYVGSSWTWTDGDTGVVEVYGADYNNRVVSRADRDGNAVTYAYANDKISRITTADGGFTELVWQGNNLERLTTTAIDPASGNNKTITRTRYTYDGYNRLSTVSVDLSVDDNNIVDGRVYTTTYLYAGSSKLVSSISQTDGSLLQIGYDGANRVASVTETVEQGVTRTTTFAYGGGYTNITDAQGNVTTMYFDGAGQLTTLVEPAATAGGNPKITDFVLNWAGDFTYTAQFDGWSARSADNALTRTWYRYDANGNVYDRYQWGDGGYLVTRSIYGSQNQLLTETSYTALDYDGHGGAEPVGGMTTRYVYDAEMHLRFRVSPEGRVTEYRYDAPGNLTSEISYSLNSVGTAGLPEGFSWSEQDFINWLASMPDKSQSQRTDYSYDFRGNLSSSISYTRIDVAGNGILSAAHSREISVYDQYGNLLSKQKVMNDPAISYTDLASWSVGGLNVASAGTINGLPANQYSVQATGAWSAFCNGYAVTNGDTVTSSVSVRSLSASGSTSFGLYGYQSGWGANTRSVARIVSGPGTLTQEAGGLFNITGLSASEFTRIEVTRTYTEGDAGGGVYVYADRPSGWRAGQGVVATDPVVVTAKTSTETYAYDGMGRTIRYTDAKGVGTWTSYIDNLARTVVTLANGLTQTSTYNRVGELTAFDETRTGLATDLTGTMPLAGWSVGPDFSAAPAGMLDGAAATRFTQTASWLGDGVSSAWFTAVAGDTVIAAISVQGTGTSSATGFGILSSTTGWGAGNISSARIISGPGVLRQMVGGLWYVTGLSTSEVTRIEVTRTFTSSDSAAVAFYPGYPVMANGGSIIASASSILKARYDGPSPFVGNAIDLRGDVNDPAQYASYYITRTPSGALGGDPATRLTINPGQTYGATYAGATPVAAGDTLIYSFSVQAIGGNTTQLFGLYGDASGWGDLNAATFRIVSGPGSLSAYTGYGYGGLSYITGLSTTEPTRVEVTRTFTRSENAYGYIYALSATGSPGDVSYIAAPSLTRSRGDRTAFTYDSLGRQRVRIDPSGARTYYLYDKQSRKVADIAADGAVVEYRYDAVGRVVASVAYQTPLTAAQLATLVDGFNNPTNVELASARPAATASDRWSWTVYDRAGRAIETIDASGATTEFIYDAAGRVKTQWKRYYPLSAGQIDSFKTTPPAARVVPADYPGMDRQTQFYYDGDGLLVGSMDEEGYLTRNLYDQAGRKVEAIRFNNPANQANRLTDSFATVLASVGSHPSDQHSYWLYDARGMIGASWRLRLLPKRRPPGDRWGAANGLARWR